MRDIGRWTKYSSFGFTPVVSLGDGVWRHAEAYVTISLWAHRARADHNREQVFKLLFEAIENAYG